MPVTISQNASWYIEMFINIWKDPKPKEINIDQLNYES